MAEFIAFDRIDPWDESRADLRAGIVASVVANVNRGKKTKAFAPRDFMPYTKAEDERQRLKQHGDSRDWKAWRSGVRGIFEKTEKKQKG